MTNDHPITSLTVAELGALNDYDLGTTDWFVVAQSRIDGFAEATDDHQWIHVDAERAAAGPFGATIAHGYLTLSLVPRLLEQLLVVTDQSSGTNYGIDRIRFTHAVPVDSEIRLAGRIVESSLSTDGATARYRIAVRVEIRGVDKPAMVGETIYLASTSTMATT